MPEGCLQNDTKLKAPAVNGGFCYFMISCFDFLKASSPHSNHFTNSLAEGV